MGIRNWPAHLCSSAGFLHARFIPRRACADLLEYRLETAKTEKSHRSKAKAWTRSPQASVIVYTERGFYGTGGCLLGWPTSEPYFGRNRLRSDEGRKAGSEMDVLAVSVPGRAIRTGFLSMIAVLSLASPVRAADVFILKNGGRITGELLNRDQSPRENYVIQVGKDQRITLDPAQVEEAKIQSEAERQYERLLPKIPETVDVHWKMAQWCREKRLPAKEQFHLQKVVHLDPDHELARRRLGYARIDGIWVKPDEHKREQGYERFRGRWRVRQDIKAIKRLEKQDLAEKDWRRKIRMWRSWLGGRRSKAAQQQLMAIRDPAATAGLAELLTREKDRQVRSLYIDALGRIDGSPATVALLRCALEDEDEETRLLCIDQLERRHDDSQTTVTLVGALKPPFNNRRINRAAVAVGRLNIQSAIPRLIDVLTTRHKKKVGPPAGQLGVAFGRDGQGGGLGGLNVGGRARIVEHTVKNRHVLDALITLTDGVNFQYDKARWRRWYVDANTPTLVNLRRSE